MRAGVASSFGEAQLLFLIGLGFPLTSLDLRSDHGTLPARPSGGRCYTS